MKPASSVLIPGMLLMFDADTVTRRVVSVKARAGARMIVCCALPATKLVSLALGSALWASRSFKMSALPVQAAK